MQPHDVKVREGGEAMLECEVGMLAGAVQWTKDGFALGKFRTVFRSYFGQKPRIMEQQRMPIRIEILHNHRCHYSTISLPPDLDKSYFQALVNLRRPQTQRNFKWE